MMGSPRFVVLDVGHGNAAVLHDKNGLVVIDAGLRGTLEEYLQQCDQNQIVALLISHSDADHLGGASNILLNEAIRVAAVYLNPDSRQDSAAFGAFRRALADSIKRNGTVLHSQLTTTTGTQISAGQAVLRILAPGPSLAAVGNGGVDPGGRRIRTNTMSAVVRIEAGDRKVALLTGDIDRIALEHLLAENEDVRAETLVFPHHGGLPGGDPNAFATTLVNAVGPELIVFSTGRSAKYSNPHPAVVSAIRTATPNAHIACTQLSVQCAAVTPPSAPHLSGLTSEGAATRKCCAGTISISCGVSKETQPVMQAHLDFVQIAAPTALCLGRGGATAAEPQIS